MFELFDRSGEGRIGVKELTTVLRALGQNPTEAEAQDMINEVDADGSGKLDLAEFNSIMISKMKDTNVEEEMRHAFDVFDVNKDGDIDVKDLTQAMAKLGEKFTAVELREIIDEADGSGDGDVDFEEFTTVMTA